MEVSIKKTPKIKLIYEGNEYMANKPKMEHSLRLEKRLEDAKQGKDSANEAMIELLNDCGLSRELVMSFDSDELEQVVAVLGSSKKNQ